MNHPGFGIGWKNDRTSERQYLDFADDIALAAEEDHVCQEMTTNLAEHRAKFGLHISQEKTKFIRTARVLTVWYVRLLANLHRTGRARLCRPLYISGSVISKDEDVEKEVNTRLVQAATVFRRLDNIWKSSSLGLSIKLQLYTAVVISTDMYASETWKSMRRIQKKLDVFYQRNLRKIIVVTWKDKVTNTYWNELDRGDYKTSLERGDSGLRDTSSGWHQNTQLTGQWTGYQSMAEKEEAGQGRHGSQHFVTAYMQESRVERGGGTSGRSCTLEKPAAHCPEKGPEELLSAKYEVRILE